MLESLDLYRISADLPSVFHDEVPELRLSKMSTSPVFTTESCSLFMGGTYSLLFLNREGARHNCRWQGAAAPQVGQKSASFLQIF